VQRQPTWNERHELDRTERNRNNETAPLWGISEVSAGAAGPAEIEVMRGKAVKNC